MEAYKQRFIEFMVRSGVLTFGDFTTKSGRKTPYFVNTGLYRTGQQMRQLGEFYADAIEAGIGTKYDVLFGPAYKGIPLVVTTAIALAGRNRDIAFCFNRKEAKDHGERGVLVGHQPQNGERVLIIEDVTTAGTSIRAAENGVVAYAGNELEGYGNLILIRHSDNWVTAYAHAEKLLVKRGDTVKRGQVIAQAGQTGSVSTPQVHFELRQGSKPVDPLRHLSAL